MSREYFKAGIFTGLFKDGTWSPYQLPSPHTSNRSLTKPPARGGNAKTALSDGSNILYLVIGNYFLV